jgi:hypothetical protein
VPRIEAEPEPGPAYGNQIELMQEPIVPPEPVFVHQPPNAVEDAMALPDFATPDFATADVVTPTAAHTTPFGPFILDMPIQDAPAQQSFEFPAAQIIP